MTAFPVERHAPCVPFCETWMWPVVELSLTYHREGGKTILQLPWNAVSINRNPQRFRRAPER